MSGRSIVGFIPSGAFSIGRAFMMESALHSFVL